MSSGAKNGARMIANGTVGKALHMLDIVAAFGKPVRFNDILAKSPFPKASTYRFLQSLTNQRMLSLDPDTLKYAVGLRLMRLAYHAWRQASLAPIAAPFIDDLSAKTGETIHLAQLDHGQVLYVDKRNAKKPVSMFSDAGKIGPAYCTGVGKAMLAYLSDKEQKQVIAQQSFFGYTEHTILDSRALKNELIKIRDEGISFDREEHEAGIICIAAPILSRGGRVIGGMSITSSTRHQSIKGLGDYENELKTTAKNIGNIASEQRFPEHESRGN